MDNNNMYGNQPYNNEPLEGYSNDFFANEAYQNMNSGSQYGNQTYANPEVGNVFTSGINNFVANSNMIETITQTVVTRSFLFMFVALVITAFAALTTSPAAAISIMMGNGFYVLIAAEVIVVMLGNWAINKENVVAGAILYTI